MRWQFGEGTGRDAVQEGARLASVLGVASPLGRVLWARGYREPAQAERFLEPRFEHLPNPFELKGIEAAVSRLQRALGEGEQICVYGDYDVDGVTSTALLVSVLRKLGGKVDFYVPHRLVEGYGLNTQALAKIAARGTRLVVSADCGVTAVAEIDAAARLGVDVVVIDHHTASQDLPRAVAILNPHQPGCTFPGRELAAVGVAFHLLLALRKRLREAGWFATRPEPNLREVLDLVALGTIADVVPLTGPNRVLVWFGLRELARGARPGVLALKSVAQLAGEVTAGDVGFKLGPRINAAGRLDDASVGVRLLLCEDLRDARVLAEQLDRANAERQDLQARIAGEAVAQAEQLGTPEQRRTLVVSSPGWHAGVVGIVAARLVERFHRPALVIAEEGGVAKGSGRSVEGFHLYDALARCAHHLTRFGGHKHAAGVTLDTSRIGAFAQALEAQGREALDPAQLSARLRIDAELHPAEVRMDLATQLRRLAPFGAGNPEPVFFCRELAAHEVRLLPDKKGTGPGHLKLRLGEAGARVAEQEPLALDAIGFNLGGTSLPVGSRLDAAFQLCVDTWNGADRLQLKLKDLKV
jgi:single-stranded-DNA-specific exonuclease